MNVHKILDNIELLRTFQEAEETSISDVATACSESRSSVYRFLSDAEKWRLIASVPDEYTVTAAGDLVLRQYDSLEREHQAAITTLSRAEYAPVLLAILDGSTLPKAEMARQSGAARSTVQRNIEMFQEEGWISKQNGGYELSSLGKDVLDAYLGFKEAIEVIDDKIEFLERLEDVEELPPLEALAESRMVVSTVTDSQEVVREVNKLDIGAAEPLRGISHSFSQEISEQYESKVTLDTECELIVDRAVYTAITNPKRWKYFFSARRRPNFRLLVLPESVTVGVGLFGDEMAMIVAYNKAHPFHAALLSENEAFINWIERIYEHYRAQANPPGTDLFNWAVGI